MRVVVQGAGSLGSLVAGLLADAGEDVALLGHPSEHLDSVRDGGLVVEHPDGGEATTTTTDPEAATDPSVVAGADLAVVCVKSYDTAGAARDLAGSLDAGTDVLTLQNGLGNAETLAEHVPPGDVLAGTTTHGAVLESPGVVRHAGEGETTVGRYFAATDGAARGVAETLSRAGLDAAATADPERAVWTKVLVNAGINAATALARVRNGALVEAAPGERLLERAVGEGVEVAAAAGVDVSADIVDQTREVARRTASNRSSMRQDVEAGSGTEVEALHGALAERADEHGVDAPVLRTLADLVRLAEHG